MRRDTNKELTVANAAVKLAVEADREGFMKPKRTVSCKHDTEANKRVGGLRGRGVKTTDGHDLLPDLQCITMQHRTAQVSATLSATTRHALSITSSGKAAPVTHVCCTLGLNDHPSAYKSCLSCA